MESKEESKTKKVTPPKQQKPAQFPSVFISMPKDDEKILNLHINNLTRSQRKRVFDDPNIFKITSLYPSDGVKPKEPEDNSSNTKLGESVMSKLSRCLQSTHKSYAILDLSGLSIPVKQLIKHISGLNSISILDISYNGRILKKEPKAKYFNRFLREILLKKCRKTLKKLNVAKIGIQETIAKDFCIWISRMKVLQKLDLSGNLIGEEAAIVLANVLKSNDTILSIDISANRIGDAGGREILNAMYVNETLQDLNIALNDLSRDLGAIIHAWIKWNKGLKRINFSFNKLGNEGFKACIDALPYNEQLMCINLAGNDIDFDGFEYLINFQHSMYSIALKKMNLYLNCISEEQKRKMPEFTQKFGTKILYDKA